MEARLVRKKLYTPIKTRVYSVLLMFSCLVKYDKIVKLLYTNADALALQKHNSTTLERPFGEKVQKAPTTLL